jgi:hypothetical protein
MNEVEHDSKKRRVGNFMITGKIAKGNPIES